MKSKFHSGEIAVQKQAGVQDMAKQVAKVIRLTLPPNLRISFTTRGLSLWVRLMKATE